MVNDREFSTFCRRTPRHKLLFLTSLGSTVSHIPAPDINVCHIVKVVTFFRNVKSSIVTRMTCIHKCIVLSFLSFTLYFFFRKVKVTKLKEVIDANVNCYDDGQDSAASDVITVTFYPGCLILFQACNVNLLLNKDWIQEIIKST